MNDNRKPTFFEENSLWSQGRRAVAGIDEVGRGALAGPVAAGAVVLPPRLKADWLDGVRDSKLLTSGARERLAKKISGAALSCGVGLVSPRMIDIIGIMPATRLAMQRAISSLKCQPDSILIDYFILPGLPLPQKGVADGDTLCLSIACASIIAKVARDRIMVNFDRRYPGYFFAENKGYGTPEHLDQLVLKGFSPIHRLSFHPQRMLPGFAVNNGDEA